MKKEPGKKQENTISIKGDVKDFIVRGNVGERRELQIDEDVSMVLDDENTLSTVKGEVTLTLLDNEILAEFQVEYLAETVCARCLKKFERKGNLGFHREYLIGKRVPEDDKLLVDKKFQIELGEPIYEEVVLDIPMKPICAEDCKGIK